MIALVHVSDLHIPPLPAFGWREWTWKRWLAYGSWQRKRKHSFSAELLQAFMAELQAQPADGVLVTGDICNLSLQQEFTQSLPWLAQFGTAEHVHLVPGNHDAHGRRWRHDWAQHWQPFMTGDDGDTTFPYLRRRAGVAIIGANSAVPTALGFADGRLGRAQCERLRHLLATARAEGLFRLLLIHHPPQAGAVRWRKALRDAAALRQVLHEEGAELVLHGHAHAPMRASLAGPGQAVLVRGCAAMASCGHRMPLAHYHRLAIVPQAQGWALTIEHRQWSPQHGRFDTVDIEQHVLTAGATAATSAR